MLPELEAILGLIGSGLLNGLLAAKGRQLAVGQFPTPNSVDEAGAGSTGGGGAGAGSAGGGGGGGAGATGGGGGGGGGGAGGRLRLVRTYKVTPARRELSDERHEGDTATRRSRLRLRPDATTRRTFWTAMRRLLPLFAVSRAETIVPSRSPMANVALRSVTWTGLKRYSAAFATGEPHANNAMDA